MADISGPKQRWGQTPTYKQTACLVVGCVDLREEFRSGLRGKRSRATEVVDLLFGNPVMTVRIVVNRLGVTPQGATLLLRQVVDAKILDEPRTGPGRRTRYTCQALMGVLAG